MHLKSKSNHGRLEPPAHKPPIPGWAIVLLVAVIVLALGIWWFKSPSVAETPAEPAPQEAQATNPPVATTAGKPDFQRIKGQWQRPDGGYVIEITTVDEAGKMEAAYFNPQSIHVAKAQARQDGAAIRVFIELQDVNYPGCTYNLSYEPESDRLKGIYYQALQQQSYEVFFVRLP